MTPIYDHKDKMTLITYVHKEKNFEKIKERYYIKDKLELILVIKIKMTLVYDHKDRNHSRI